MVIISGVPIFRIFTVIYTTLISVDLAQYEIFPAKVCDFWQGGYTGLLDYSIFRTVTF